MILPDVNVLIYAHREDSEHHKEYKSWLENTLKGPGNFGVCDLVLSSFIRIVTHPKIFNIPTPLPLAITFTDTIRTNPLAVIIKPGERHWAIFTDLCRSCDAKGNLTTDAYLAALSIESGCEWITTDRDFARFTDLRWRHPLKS